MPFTQPAARVPLRRSLVLAAFTLVLGTLAAFVAALYLFVVLPGSRELATAQLRVASEQVEVGLAGLVRRVEALVRQHRAWGRDGLIDVDDPQRFNTLMRPILEHGPQLSSAVVATESGRELLLLRRGDQWVNRLTDPQRQPRQARLLTWNAQGQLLKDETRELDYDARTRPWFQGGMALATDQDVFWSAPYTFRSSNEPGLSVVVRWTAADGLRRVMTSDLKLADLSRFTRDIVAGTHGFVAVFTDDGRLMGAPHDPAFATDEAIQAAMLKPVPAIGIAPLAAGFALWRQSGSHDSDLLRYDVDGRAWLASFQRSPFGAQTFWVATMAPEADFLPGGSTQLLAFAAIVLGTLGLAWFSASRLARRFSGPLAQLAAQSQRIGRLQLDEPVQVRTPWIELDDLAQAQESMRRELQGATQRLAQANDSLESKVTERTRELEAARDLADAASRAKAEFLANMSHEIRTPMNAILGMTDLALRSELTPRQRDYLSKTRAAGSSLLGIINDILDFSKVEAGKLVLEHREFALQPVFDRVTAVVGLKAQEQGLELLLDTAPDVPPRLVGDALRLEQVLINLCSNAVKFTESGEIVVVTVKLMRAADAGVTLRFAVRDTGIGMDEGQVAQLFLPFSQLDASATRRHGGSGLGLAISKQLVGLMGGEIGVHSQPGKGSEFWFTAVFGVAATVPGEAPPILRGALRILVVDDSANSRQIFDGLLRSLGHRPVLASSGEQGLAELQRAAPDAGYDLVLLDWRMPGLDGFEVARRIRRLHGLQPTPKIILVTAYGDEALTRRAASEGLDGCLSKPVNASTLVDALLNTLGERVHPAGGRAGPGAGDGPVTAPAVLRGRRVLLAEDNEFNQMVACELLGDVAGMVVTLVQDGQQAVERARMQPFDVVLMDIQMPVMDGYEATRRIRQEASLQQLPIIAMTAHAMPRDRQRSLDVGMNDHVSKPFEPAELFAALARWVAPSGAPASSPASPPAAEGVNFALGLSRCLGRRELYHKVLRNYLGSHGEDAGALRRALDAGDAEAAGAIAHSAISTAGTIGAEALSDIARQLQVALYADEPLLWPDLMARFAQQHALVLAQLREHLAQADSAPAQPA